MIYEHLNTMYLCVSTLFELLRPNKEMLERRTCCVNLFSEATLALYTVEREQTCVVVSAGKINTRVISILLIKL